MARKKKKTANVRREAFGIFMQALWVLLLLALVSYTYQDIPLECSPAQSPTANYIGPVGAWAAWGILKVFGFVGFAAPLMLAVWGIWMIVQSMERVWPRVLWMLGMLSALCVLVDIQSDFWNGLDASRLNLQEMPGGFVGYLVGRLFLTHYLGTVGAAIISIGVVVAGVFFVSQTHPKELWGVILGAWARMQAHREEWIASRQSAQERAEREARRMEKEREKLLREMERERKLQEKEDRRREREEARIAREEERAAKEAERQAQAEAREREKEEQRRLREEEEARRKQEEADRREAYKRQLEEQKKADAARKAAEAQALEQARAAAASAQAETADSDTPPPTWVLPPNTLLQPIPEGAGAKIGGDELAQTTQVLQDTLAEFGIEAEVTHVEQGPVVTRYELLPAAGVKVEKIGSYSGNLALALKAESIRVQAPIPGKGVVGVEVPNRKPKPVVLRQLLESAKWATSHAALPLALGQDVGGHVLMADLAKLPHMLIAGATGQGKTVCMNSILAGLLTTRKPEELRLILIDPKIVEFSGYADLPHLYAPVITEAKKVVKTLAWAIQEMERRFKLFHKVKVRDIASFNQRPKVEQPSLFDGQQDGAEGEPVEPQAEAKPDPDAVPDTLPYIVIIIDELADLMLTAQQDIEPQIQKLTQLARATGIHMIIATQRPTVNIITGTIKSNIPGRVAFKVAQKNDSRVVIDQEGADKLVGKGDMLVLAGSNKIQRAQGAWTKDEEIHGIVEHWKAQGKPQYAVGLQAKIEGKGGIEIETSDEDEELIEKAIEVIRATRRASTSSIQRRLRIGYTRAARLIDVLEDKGMVGPPRGSEPREILFDLDAYESSADEDGGEEPPQA